MINLKPVTGYQDKVVLVDQTLLPIEEKNLEITSLAAMCDAIKRLVVRGAPAIGIAAAYALSLHCQQAVDVPALQRLFQEAFTALNATRPTAVNLAWALERMERFLETQLKSSRSLCDIKDRLYNEASAIEKEDYEMCRKIGANGYALFAHLKEIKAMTICNAGGYATAGFGTALAPFYIAQEHNKNLEVFALETRPLLQGSRITAYELMKAGVQTTLLTDNMAAALMREKKIDFVITGADRIAANGDTANKIGTFQLAILARYHHIPFYVAAPYSTLDDSLPTGRDIPIEYREKDEIIHFGNRRTAPENVKVFSPAFDVTPSELISAIITESGVFYPPFRFEKE